MPKLQYHVKHYRQPKTLSGYMTGRKRKIIY